VVTRIIHDFRRYIGWRAALFPYDFSMIIYDAANAKVAQFNPSRCINQNVIELNISVQDRPAMTVTNAINNLSKDCLGFILADRPALLHKRKQISAGCILHNDKYVCFCLKHLIQPYYILMPHDTQKTNFCFDLLVLKVSKLCFVDDLQSNFFLCQVVDRKCDFAEGSFTQQGLDVVVFDELALRNDLRAVTPVTMLRLWAVAYFFK
jgi:hypothetical protein